MMTAFSGISWWSVLMGEYFVTRDTCPACGAAESGTLYTCRFTQDPIREYLDRFYHGRVDQAYLADATYILRECAACGMVYQHECPSDALAERIYERWLDAAGSLAWHERVDDFDYYRRVAAEIIVLLAYFKAVPSTLRFLDFGMGWARWARMARAFGVDASGSEISDARLAYAASQGVPVIAWDEMASRQWDFINLEQVCEHMTSPLETLRHLSRSLKRGNGLLKIATPDGTDIKERLAVMDWRAEKKTPHSLNAVAPLEHVNCFHRAAIERMGRLAGLEPVPLPFRVAERTCVFFRRAD